MIRRPGYGRMLNNRFAQSLMDYVRAVILSNYMEKDSSKLKFQTLNESESWPYSFPASEDFPKWNQRGNISGRLQVQDRSVFVSILVFVSTNSPQGLYL